MVPISISQTRNVLGGSLAAVVASDGFAFVKNWHPDLRSEEIVTRVGSALPLGTNNAVHRLVPKQKASTNTYSGIYGLNDFPFHTDMAHWPTPPRYFMLRCLKGHESVATTVADGLDVIARVRRENLSRALVKPRRALNGTFPLLSLYRPEYHGRARQLRWDDKFIVPASVAGEEGMSLVRSALASIPFTSISLSDPGDTLFIDNWRMLHGRSAVAAEHADRAIERAYLGELY